MKRIISYLMIAFLVFSVAQCDVKDSTTDDKTSNTSGTDTDTDSDSDGATDNGLYNVTAPASTVKLIFIHHSCGCNWLNSGSGQLGTALNANNYFVSETYYGWNADSDDGLGNATNTDNWPLWFNATKMPYVYTYYDMFAGCYTNTLSDPGGENEIIMFKSCYPLSEVGDSIDDEKTIYNGLLDYFETQPNKLFVLITPPGETSVSSYALTRELCTWLVDRENGWLKDYSLNNVAVYDFYCTLSETDSHHRIVDSAVEHVYAGDYDGNSPYHSGDNHPNATGNQKATAEFIPLLNGYYNKWKGIE